MNLMSVFFYLNWNKCESYSLQMSVQHMCLIQIKYLEMESRFKWITESCFWLQIPVFFIFSRVSDELVDNLVSNS